ncbi:MAG: flagellar biosynthetic protein FliO [Salinisphaeraceae bacterium]|nr:flagellar biosynthetic protein FliO [Salinisphaeraceae bacterium]
MTMEQGGSMVASPMAGWAQVFISLMLVLAVLIGTLWLLRRLQGGLSFSSQGLRVAGGLSLGGKERVVVLDVNGQLLLLGVSPGGVTLLQALEDMPRRDHPAAGGVPALLRRWQHDRNRS